MMIKVVLFAYMNHLRSVRDMEKACRRDIRFMWLAQEHQPSHQAFQRFIKNKLTTSIENIFHDINEQLIQMDEIDTSKMFIDGTNFEANANKFTFIWKKVAIRTSDNTFHKLNEEVKNICQYIEDVSEQEIWVVEDVNAIIFRLDELMMKENIEKVYGKGKRKTPIQRIYDKLIAYRNTLLGCFERITLCGPHRNSCSKIDHDATFMHMKYDYYNHTGVFKPGYNIQVGVCDEYVMHTLVSQARSDAPTFLPFFECYKKIRELPKVIVADAGYGNYDAYFYCLDHNIKAYIKYITYRIEKTKKNQKKTRMGSKYLRINDTYECHHCRKCEVKSECTKAQGNRKLMVNPILEEFQRDAKELLDSKEGVALRKRRSAEAEGVFGIIKQDYGYERIQRRGLENVNIEILLVCIGFNLNKYHNKKIRKKHLN